MLYAAHSITNNSILPMKTVSVQEFHEMQENGETFQLIDVREPDEYEQANLGGTLIPLSTVLHEAPEKISKEETVIVHCRSGKRSAMAIGLLEQQYGYENLYNLEGGVLAYIDAFGL